MRSWDEARASLTSPRWAALWGAAVIVTAGTATSKVASLAKDVVVAGHFGNGEELDMFLLALALPTFFVNLAAGTLPAALTPAYVAAREQHGIEHARELAGRSLRTTYQLLCGLAAIVVVGSMLMPAGDPRTGTALVWLALSLAPFTILQGACAAWTGLLAAERRYLVGALAPVVQPALMVIVVLATVTALGAYALVAGLLAGTLAQATILGLALRRCGVPLLARGAMPAEVRSEYLPAAGGALVMSAGPVIDQVMAASLAIGSVSALHYGGKYVSVVMSVGSMVLSTTLLPLFSQHVAQRAYQELRLLLRTLPLLVLGVTVPLTLTLLVLSPWLVRATFERGAFSADDAALVSRVQQLLLLQLPVHLLGIVYVRLLSALRANRVLLAGATISLVVNFGGNLLFMRGYGVSGIAFATSLVYLVSCLFLGWSVHRRLRQVSAAARPALAMVAAAATSPGAEATCASAA